MTDGWFGINLFLPKEGQKVIVHCNSDSIRLNENIEGKYWTCIYKRGEFYATTSYFEGADTTMKQYGCEVLAWRAYEEKDDDE